MAITMSSNLTQVQLANSALQLVLFFFAILPAMVLCILCIIAFPLANAINWKVRATLLNIFAAKIVQLTARAFILLSYPIIILSDDEVDSTALCKVIFIMLNVSKMAYMPSITLYAIMVYIFMKYGTKKLKWYVIIPYISISWVVAVLFGMSYAADTKTFELNGFCGTKLSPLFFAQSITVSVIVLGCMIIIITFTIISQCYVKKAVLEGSIEIKKAIAKNSIILTSGAILNVILNSVSTFSPLAQKKTFDSLAGIIGRQLLQSVLVFVAFCTPIATIIVLKPVRDAIKKFCSVCKNKCCTCCARNS